MSHISSPCISVLWVDASQATTNDINLHTFRPHLLRPSWSSSVGNRKVCDRFNTGYGALYMSIQAWEWIVIKTNWKYLAVGWGWGATPSKIREQRIPFGAVWCILINYKNSVHRTGTLSWSRPRSKSISVFIKFQSATGSLKMNIETP